MMGNWLQIFKPNRPSSSAAARICERCSAPALNRTLATYPVPLTGKLEGKRVDVYRVEVDLCRRCGHLMPTPEGHAKIKRCVKTGIEFFRRLPPKS
jgi:ribosomal protein L40E